MGMGLAQEDMEEERKEGCYVSHEHDFLLYSNSPIFGPQSPGCSTLSPLQANFYIPYLGCWIIRDVKKIND